MLNCFYFRPKGRVFVCQPRKGRVLILKYETGRVLILKYEKGRVPNNEGVWEHPAELARADQ